MKYIIAMDIGNTNITVGLFHGPSIVNKTKIATHNYASYEPSIKKLLRESDIKVLDVNEVIISSVVPLALSRIMMHLNKVSRFNIKVVGRDLLVPIKNCYKAKSEVGQDRLVNAFAAQSLHGAPCVVIDFGTAITFDIVSRSCAYEGGVILPGIEMSLASLYKNTALLPRVELKAATDIIGKDTVSSMRGGILFGFGAMCDGLVKEYKKLLGANTKVIATGGNAALVKKYARSIQVVDENLTLKGLILILK